MQKYFKLVNFVIEVRDARAPLTSTSPLLKDWVINKPHLIIFNKIDLADANITLKWQKYFKTCGQNWIWCNSRESNVKNQVLKAISKMSTAWRKKQLAKGMIHPQIRIIVLGIPNTGKSSLINQLKTKKVTKVGSYPGVTRGLQWVKINQDCLLLDTPGILWPKITEQDQQVKLAIINTIKVHRDQVTDLVLRIPLLMESIAPKIWQQKLKLNSDQMTALAEHNLKMFLPKYKNYNSVEDAAFSWIKALGNGDYGLWSWEIPPDLHE